MPVWSHELRPTEIPLSDVTLATGARTHSLFSSGGRVLACGSGQYGVLGTGSTASSSTPTPVVGLPSTTRVTALTSSWEGSGALLSNGAYYDWGYNAAGQLGDGTTTNSAVPVQVALPAAARQVFQGGSGAKNGQTVAILSNGTVWAWGDNDRGQLGNGTRVSSTVPLRVDVPGGVSFVKVSSGGFASYAIDRLGRLWAWGDNKSGQLGTGSRPTHRHQAGQRRHSPDARSRRPPRTSRASKAAALGVHEGWSSCRARRTALLGGYDCNFHLADGSPWVASSTPEALRLTAASKGRD